MIFFSEFNFFILAVKSKWVKLGKSVIKKHRSVLSLPKNQNKLNFFSVTDVYQKNFKVLGDFGFFL